MATVKVTPDVIKRALRRADWAKIDAQTDDGIARNTASDPDAPPILSRTQMAAAIAKTVRKRLDLSQVEFAARFEIPDGEVARLGTGPRTTGHADASLSTSYRF